MKILITGAAGFIGSGLAKKILDDCDWKVWALDNNFRYSFDFLEKIVNPRLHIVKGDICDSGKIVELFRENFDFVVHLAAVPGERLCQKYPEETIRTNIYGTRVLLEQSLKNKIRGFLFASSQVVYGEPKESSIKESHPIQPYDLYSFSKAAGEILLEIYKKKGLSAVIFRFSSVYGYGLFARWNEVLGRFVKLAHEKDYLTIYKPMNIARAGEQGVDLIHVKDINDGIIETIKNINKTLGKTYNLSQNQSFSILELAELIKELAKEKLQKELRFETISTREIEFPKIEVSNEKIKNDISWKPKTTIKEGIEDLWGKYSWYKEKYGDTKEPSLIETPQRA